MSAGLFLMGLAACRDAARQLLEPRRLACAILPAGGPGVPCVCPPRPSPPLNNVVKSGRWLRGRAASCDRRSTQTQQAACSAALQLSVSPSPTFSSSGLQGLWGHCPPTTSTPGRRRTTPSGSAPWTRGPLCSRCARASGCWTRCGGGRACWRAGVIRTPPWCLVAALLVQLCPCLLHPGLCRLQFLPLRSLAAPAAAALPAPPLACPKLHAPPCQPKATSLLPTLLLLLSGRQAWSYPGGMTPERKSARARVLAVWIRERILQLGPTYIKLGQVGACLGPPGAARSDGYSRGTSAAACRHARQLRALPGAVPRPEGAHCVGSLHSRAWPRPPSPSHPPPRLQLFSTRSDLFPPEFTEELSKLQVGGPPPGGASPRRGRR